MPWKIEGQEIPESTVQGWSIKGSDQSSGGWTIKGTATPQVMGAPTEGLPPAPTDEGPTPFQQPSQPSAPSIGGDRESNLTLTDLIRGKKQQPVQPQAPLELKEARPNTWWERFKEWAHTPANELTEHQKYQLAEQQGQYQQQGETSKALQAIPQGAAKSYTGLAALPSGVLRYDALAAKAIGGDTVSGVINRIADYLEPTTAKAQFQAEAPDTKTAKILSGAAELGTSFATPSGAASVASKLATLPKWALPALFAAQAAGNSASAAHERGLDASDPVKATLGSTTAAGLAYLTGHALGTNLPGPRLASTAAQTAWQTGAAGAAGALTQLGENYVAKKTYDPNRPMLENVLQSTGLWAGSALLHNNMQNRSIREGMLDHPQGPEGFMQDTRAMAEAAQKAGESGAMKPLEVAGAQRFLKRAETIYNGLARTKTGQQVMDAAPSDSDFSMVRQMYPSLKGEPNGGQQSTTPMGQLPSGPQGPGQEGSGGVQPIGQGQGPAGAGPVEAQGQEARPIPDQADQNEVQQKEIVPILPRQQGESTFDWIRREADHVSKNPEQAMMKYAQTPGTENGSVIGADQVGKMFGGIQADPVSGWLVAPTEEASRLATMMEDRAIAQPIPEGKPNRIAILAGPPGAGKSEIAGAIGAKNGAAYVFDGLNLDANEVSHSIERIKATGKEPSYTMVLAPLDTLVNRNAERFTQEGRPVNPMQQAQNLIKAKETLSDLNAKYGQDDIIKVAVNEDGKSPQIMSPEDGIRWIDDQIGDKSEKQLAEQALETHSRAIERIHRESPLSEDQFDALHAAAATDAEYGPALYGKYGAKLSRISGEQAVPGGTGPEDQGVKGETQDQGIGQAAEGPTLQGQPVANKEQERKAFRDQDRATIQDLFPGEEHKAIRNLLYRKGLLGQGLSPDRVFSIYLDLANEVTPNGDPVLSPEGGAVALPEIKGDMLRKVTKNILEGMYHAIADPIKAAKGIMNDGVVELAKQLDKNNQIQKLPKGAEFPTISESMIDPELPKPAGDLTATQIGQHFRSPHNLEDAVWKAPDGFTVDRMIADNDRTIKTAAYTLWASKLLKGVKDSSAIVQRVMSPAAKGIFDASEKLTPLLKEREEIQKRIDKSQSDISTRTFERALEDFDKRNGRKIEALTRQKDAGYRQAKTAIMRLAQKYADVRIALAAEDTPWVKALMKPGEQEIAEKIKEGMKTFSTELGKRGIDAEIDQYLPHLIRPLDAARYTTPEGQKQIREVLGFHQRDPNSINLFPTIHGAMSYYIPTVSKKLAEQPLYNKWVPSVAEAGQHYLDPNSEYYAPQFGAWLKRNLEEIQNVQPRPFGEGILRAAKNFEILKTIAFSPRVAVKHSVKTLNLLGLHHTWLLPAGKDLAIQYAKKAENIPLVGEALKSLESKPQDTDLVQALMANLMATKQIGKMLREDPLVADYQNQLFGRQVGPGLQMAKTLGTKAMNLAGYPTTAIESLENGLNILATMQHGQAAGLDPSQNIKNVIMNILDYNYRGGADAAKYQRDRIGALTMFTQTPAKGIELQAKLLKKALAGEKDIYGSPYSAQLIRHIIALGAASILAEKFGHNIFKMMLHPPSVNIGWSGHIAKAAYLGAWGKLAGIPIAERKAKDELAMSMGDWKGPFSLTPVTGVVSDLYSLVVDPMALFKDASAYKQGKAIVSGEPPRGYKDVPHYLSDSPTPEEEQRREEQAKKAGYKMMKSIHRRAQR